MTFPGPLHGRAVDEPSLNALATRRGARAVGDPAQHARRPPRAVRIAAVAAVAALLIATIAVATSLAARTDAPIATSVEPSPPLPAAASALPAPVLESAVPVGAMCELPTLQAALAAGDDVAAVAASGGGEAFRSAVATGGAPCVALDDPARGWVVVNKLRGYTPADYEPSGLIEPPAMRNLVGGRLQPAAADALSALVATAATEGVGEIALDSGYRSFSTQRTTYRSQVASRGAAGADLISARPGFSEHQSGLAADVVSCVNNGCSSIADFAATPAGTWVADNSWRFGWIVRYAEGQTGVTGYQPEPWHLRYVGIDLARAYHDGGYYSLEQFFGLPVAPDYAD